MLLRLLAEGCDVEGGALQTRFEEPFENLRLSNLLSQTKEKELGAEKAPDEIWLRK